MKKVENSQTVVAPTVAEFTSTEGLKINQNRPVWDEIYVEIRRLAVKKASLIRKFTDGKVKPQNVCIYRYGEVKFKPAFDLLSDTQKKELVSVTNKLTDMYTSLKAALA